MVCREIFKITREVPVREGILGPAVFGDDLGEFSLAVMRRALEHHVFVEMGEAGFPRNLIARSDFVPDLKCDHRGLVLFKQDYLEAVGQRELLDGRGLQSRRPGKKT